MTIIDSLLRKKRLILAERTRCYLEAVSVCEKAERTFDLSERQYAEAQRYLWELFEAEASLDVQRLAVARQDEQRRSGELRDARSARDSAVVQVNTLQQVVSRLHKDIEKLEEKRDERRRQTLLEAQKLEWTRLDERAATQHGPSAP